MINIKELLSRNAIEFRPEALETLNRPGVYMFVRDDRALYIGASDAVVGRALARNHHKRKVFKDALKGASLIIFPCQSLADARELEDRLIHELRPEHNQRGGWKQIAKILGYATAGTAATAYKR